MSSQGHHKTEKQVTQACMPTFPHQHSKCNPSYLNGTATSPQATSSLGLSLASPPLYAQVC